MKNIIRIISIACFGIYTAHSMDTFDLIPQEKEVIYYSLQELQEKASHTSIDFIHGLSEFTYSKINPDTLEFFKENGNLFDNTLQPGPHVKIVDSFAIDLVTRLAWSRDGWIRLGQNSQTKQFVAFKPMEENSDEIDNIKKLNEFQGIIEYIETEDSGSITGLCFVGMHLVDGVTFYDMNSILPKINVHARYLITYNLIKELKRFIDLGMFQQDHNWKNFMITSDLNVKIIDYGAMSEDKWNVNFMPIQVSWFDLLFSKGDQSRHSPEENIKKYSLGTFMNILETIESKRPLCIVACTLVKHIPILS